jgi:hypothetical protein
MIKFAYLRPIGDHHGILSQYALDFSKMQTDLHFFYARSEALCCCEAPAGQTVRYTAAVADLTS